ncbi:MAG: LysR family transcriptional regulator [Erysipelotrichaceae bacterium]|nr:LysR family transcriptional regulator [Erysipelotrichaceae bacterium]
MEIRTLRYFLAVAREENMTKAAQLLHVTQPTLSKQMKALETELGKKLFVRHSFSIALTDEGMLLRNRAEDLVRMADKIEQEFVSLDDLSGGQLYLGLAESVQIRYLAKAIRQFKQEVPSLHYHITSGDTEQIAEQLDKGLLDFVVLAERPDDKKYLSLAFPEQDRWGLVFPASDPLARKQSLTINDLTGLPLFCSEQSWTQEIKEWAADRFEQLHLEGSFRLSYNGSIFAREGLGYLLTFDQLIDTSEQSGLVFRPLSPALHTKLFLAWNRYQTFTPVSRRFLEHVRRQFQTQ